MNPPKSETGASGDLAREKAFRRPRSRLEALADRITGGSLVPMITQLIEDEKLALEEIERLRTILEER